MNCRSISQLWAFLLILLCWDSFSANSSGDVSKVDWLIMRMVSLVAGPRFHSPPFFHSKVKKKNFKYVVENVIIL